MYYIDRRLAVVAIDQTIVCVVGEIVMIENAWWAAAWAGVCFSCGVGVSPCVGARCDEFVWQEKYPISCWLLLGGVDWGWFFGVMLWLLIRSCNTVSVYAEGARIVKMSYFGYSLDRQKNPCNLQRDSKNRRLHLFLRRADISEYRTRKIKKYGR